MNLAILLSKELKNVVGLPIRYFLKNNVRLTVYNEIGNKDIIFRVLENDVLVSVDYTDFYMEYILLLIKPLTAEHKINYEMTLTNDYTKFYS